MVAFLLLLCVITVVAISAIIFLGMGGFVAVLVFGDVIIAGYIVYRIIKAILEK